MSNTDYLKETKLLNFSCDSIQNLINERGWKELDDFNKIKEVYNYIRDEIIHIFKVKE